MKKFRRIRWTRHVARMVEMGNTYYIWDGKPEWRDHSEDLGVDGMLLKWILGKWDGRMWTGPVAGSGEHAMNIRFP
jgi:hypothetical protein